MAISEEDVKKIAKLARLRLRSEEVSLYQAQLVKILDSMAELSALDTSGVPPTTSVLGLTNILREPGVSGSRVPSPQGTGSGLREDKPEPFKGVERLLSNAPEREGPYYKVKKVIE